MAPKSAPKLASLPPDLLARCFTHLPLRDRLETLPLVCCGWRRLLSKPGELWSSLDVVVPRQAADAQTNAKTLARLRERGLNTQGLRLRTRPHGGSLEPAALAAIVPTCFPRLATLSISGWVLSPRDVQLLSAECPGLQALEICLAGECFAEAAQAVCSYTKLTLLALKALPNPSAEACEALTAALHGLGHLSMLSLDFTPAGQDVIVAGTVPPEFKEFVWPASLARCLPRLERLTLQGFWLLPSSFSELRCLSRLTLNPISVRSLQCGGWDGLVGLQAIHHLYANVIASVSHTLPSEAFLAGCWSRLTCLILHGAEAKAPISGVGKLVLPALHELRLHGEVFAHHIDCGSLSALRCLKATLDWEGGAAVEGIKAICRGARLTSLSLSRGDASFPFGGLLALSALKDLRCLELDSTGVAVLSPELKAAKLTSLVLQNNGHLVLDSLGYGVLRSLPALASLKICVCLVQGGCPCFGAESMQVLRLICASLPACKACECHAVDFEPEEEEIVEAVEEDGDMA